MERNHHHSNHLHETIPRSRESFLHDHWVPKKRQQTIFLNSATSRFVGYIDNYRSWRRETTTNRFVATRRFQRAVIHFSTITGTQENHQQSYLFTAPISRFVEYLDAYRS